MDTPRTDLLSLAFAADSARLAGVRDAVRRALQRQALPEAECENLVMAIDEAAANVIRHGYQGGHGQISLSIRLQDDLLCIRLCDDAPTLDPDQLRARPLGELRPGGLGLHLIQSAVDRFDYQPGRDGTGNCLNMFRKLQKGSHET